MHFREFINLHILNIVMYTVTVQFLVFIQYLTEKLEKYNYKNINQKDLAS